jgi:hypothetical protein
MRADKVGSLPYTRSDSFLVSTALGRAYSVCWKWTHSYVSLAFPLQRAPKRCYPHLNCTSNLRLTEPVIAASINAIWRS